MSSSIKKCILVIALITFIILPNTLENHSVYATTQTLLHWDFNILDFYEGWQLQNISNNRVQNGYLYGENTSGDPQMRLPGIALDASRYDTLEISLKNQTNSTVLQVFWTTSSAPDIIKGPKNVTISANDTSFNQYSIDMTHTDWTGTISQIRIDPVNASGSFYIDYIKFTGTPAYESYGSVIDITTSSGSVSSTYTQIEGSLTTAIVEEAIGYEVRHGSLNGTLVDSGVLNAASNWSFTARHLNEGDNYIRVYCRDIDRIEHEDYIVLNMSLSSEPSVRPRPVPAEVWWGGCAPLEQLYYNPNDWAFVKKYADGFFMHHAAWRPTVKYSVNMTDEVLAGIGNQVNSSGLRASFELATLTARYYGNSVIETWDFNTDANFENWNLANVSNATVKDGYITGQPTSADPQMYITGLSINADEVKGLRIIMKNETGSTKFQIFYTNPGDSGFTTQKYFEYTNVHANDDEYVQYDINLTGQQGWQGTINALRIDPVNGTSYNGTFKIDSISLLKYGVVEDWGFNNDGNLDGWNVSNINNATVADSALSGEPANSNPYIWKDNLSFDAAQVKNIRIALKNQTGSEAIQIYWRNPGDSGFTEEKSYIYKPVRPDDSTYVIYGSIIPNWTGKITHLRIDPVMGDDWQGSFSIDKITLYGLGSLDQSNFSTDGNMDGWSLANINNSSVSNGYFYGEPANSDPNIYITGQSFDASLLEKIKIRIKNGTGSDKFQIFWTNPGDQGFSTSKYYEYSGVSTYDSDYKIYTIYTDNFTGWNGTINGLRIDPVNGTSWQGSISIDYIYLDMAFYTESVEGWAQKTFDGQIGAPGSNSGWEKTIQKTGIAMSTYDCDWQQNMGSSVSVDPTLTHEEQLDKFIDDFQKPFWQIFKYYYPYTEQAIIQCPIFWKWEDYPIVAPNQQDRLKFDPLKVHKPDSILSFFLDKNVLVNEQSVSYSFEMKEVLTHMKQMFSDIGKKLAFATDLPYTWAAEVSGAETGREKVLAYESWLHENGLKHYLTCHNDRTYIGDDDWDEKFYNDCFNRVILHQEEGGRADRYHLESWYNHDDHWMPSKVIPETDDYTYTRLGKDIIKFIKGIKDVNGNLEELDLDITQVNNGCEVTITNNGDIKCMPALVAFESGSSDISILWYDDNDNDITELMNSEEGWVYTSLLEPSESVTITGEYTVNQQSAQKEVKIEAFWNPQDPTGVVRDRVSWNISVAKAWEFTSSTEGWTAVNQISNFGWASGGYVNGNITGSDPYMRSGTDLGLNISDNKYIKVKMKNSTAGTTAAVLFITNSDGVWNGTKSKIFTINANDSNYTEYTIDMSTVSDWTGTLKQLRLDPVNSGATTGSFSIDYIRIQNTP